MGLRGMSEARRRVAGSCTASAVYFVVVLAALALASTWVSGCTLAFAGVLLYAAPIPFTWPLVDAALFRYAREPVASAPAKSRLHWVVAVLVGVLVSIIIGAIAGC
jgi:hypothetical protein